MVGGGSLARRTHRALLARGCPAEFFPNRLYIGAGLPDVVTTNLAGGEVVVGGVRGMGVAHGGDSHQEYKLYLRCYRQEVCFL